MDQSSIMVDKAWYCRTTLEALSSRVFLSNLVVVSAWLSLVGQK